MTSATARPATVPDMTIERVEVIPMRVPLGRVFQGSHYSMSNRCTIVTRIHTAGGLVSEVYNGDTDAEQPVIVGIIRDEIAPLLIGKSALAVEVRWHDIQAPTYDILRDRSLALQAIACVDSALWDLVGKATGLPLFRLWGGERDRLPAICIGGYYSDDEADVGRQIDRYRELGFAGCKFKVGRLSPEADARRMMLARKAAGDDFLLMADANQGFTKQDAIEFARRTQDVNLRWLEEPVGWANDKLSMRDVRLITGVPVTAGQSESTVAGLRDLMASAAVDVCNADASWIGGPTPWRKVATVASTYEIDMAHHEEAQVSAHLLASIPHGRYMEAFEPDRDPIFWHLMANRQPFRDGDYLVPEGPGFGLQLDWDYVERYRSEPA